MLPKGLAAEGASRVSPFPARRPLPAAQWKYSTNATVLRPYQATIAVATQAQQQLVITAYRTADQ